MKNRCKMKLSDIDMKVLAVKLKELHSWLGAAQSTEGLLMRESLENVFTRLRNMYRPDRNRYTVRLSMVEVQAMVDLALPYMQHGDDGYMVSFAMRLQQELTNQVQSEINIYNSMYYGR